jgi:hypothetical protein
MRLFIIVGVALLAFGVGILSSPFVTAATDREPEGHALKCIAYGRVCVGMRADRVLSTSAEDNFGGLIGVFCGFDRPGGRVGLHIVSVGELIGQGCSNPKYVAQFSDGRHLTSVWVKNGSVTQLDHVPRDTLDL